MATRTITECDRCHREIKSVAAKVSVGDRSIGKDLCEPCLRKLEAFLGGRELDEPP